MLTSEVKANLLGAELTASTLLDVDVMFHPDPYGARRKYYDKIDKKAKGLSAKIVAGVNKGETEIPVTKGWLNREVLYAPIVYTAVAEKLGNLGLQFRAFAQVNDRGRRISNIVQIEEVQGRSTELERNLSDEPNFEQIWPPEDGSGRSYRTPLEK